MSDVQPGVRGRVEGEARRCLKPGPQTGQEPIRNSNTEDPLVLAWSVPEPSGDRRQTADKQSRDARRGALYLVPHRVK